MSGNYSERLESDGFVTVERAFDPAFIDTLHEEYLRQFPDSASAGAPYVGERRIQLAVKLKGPFVEPALYGNRQVLELAKAALGDDILIDNFSMVSALPGAPDQHLHMDHADLFPEHPVARSMVRPYALNVAIPLVDLTPETGTTRLFTGSHNRQWSKDRFEQPYIARGGCYVLDYRLSHQGTGNRSGRERPILYVVYARPWFTDITNYGNNVRLNLAAADLKAIPEEHRPLFRRLAAKGAFDRTVEELFAS